MTIEQAKLAFLTYLKDKDGVLPEDDLIELLKTEPELQAFVSDGKTNLAIGFKLIEKLLADLSSSKADNNSERIVNFLKLMPLQCWKSDINGNHLSGFCALYAFIKMLDAHPNNKFMSGLLSHFIDVLPLTHWTHPVEKGLCSSVVFDSLLESLRENKNSSLCAPMTRLLVKEPQREDKEIPLRCLLTKVSTEVLCGDVIPSLWLTSFQAVIESEDTLKIWDFLTQDNIGSFSAFVELCRISSYKDKYYQRYKEFMPYLFKIALKVHPTAWDHTLRKNSPFTELALSFVNTHSVDLPPFCEMTPIV
jgi:hypothetical protein